MIQRHIVDQPAGRWIDEGACVGRPGDLWYEDRSRHTDEAVAICRECPVAALCLQWALDTGETWGVWGGKTAKERNGIKRRSTSQAPAQGEKPAPKRALRKITAITGEVVYAGGPRSNSVMPKPRPVKPERPRDTRLLDAARTVI